MLPSWNVGVVDYLEVVERGKLLEKCWEYSHKDLNFSEKACLLSSNLSILPPFSVTLNFGCKIWFFLRMSIFTIINAMLTVFTAMFVKALYYEKILLTLYNTNTSWWITIAAHRLPFAGFFPTKKKSHENFIWRMSSTHIITVPQLPQ